MANIYFTDGGYVKVAEKREQIVNDINTGKRMIQVTRPVNIKQHEGNCPDPNKWETYETIDCIEAYNVDIISNINDLE